MDVRSHNRAVWETLGSQDCPWTRPVTSAAIAAARQGHWEIYLTPTTPVPSTWLAPVADRSILCLASGGGQQGPLLAAAGARVTVLDFSEQQLARDRAVATRDGLQLETVQGDMTDLSMFADQCFNMIVHPVANVYIPDVQPVWCEAARVLRSGGKLLVGFMNPMLYIFDQDRLAANEFVVRHHLPYSELSSISAEERHELIESGDALQFSHTLAAQLAGQLAVGLYITGFYEDYRAGHPLAPYMPTHFATCAVKP
jgi:ubiquinone/menaquinone biosynthesis C-methylase UbiE